jgi:DNA-binding beta-propeller fold protein YncE
VSVSQVRLSMFLVLVLAAYSLSDAAPDENSHIRFIREFSAATDVKHESHPVLNESLNIIAGPKEQEPTNTVLEEPYAITTDPSRRVLITDLNGGVVHVFDFIQQKHFLLRGGAHLRSPMGIAADGDGNVYVSDNVLGAVLVYDRDGKFIRYLKEARGSESYFDAPEGIAVDRASYRIYVCDTRRHMLIVFNKKGDVVSHLGKRGGGSRSGEFKYPTQVALGPDEVLVLDAGNSRIQVFDKAGRFERVIELADPGRRAGLAVDEEGNVYVGDPELNDIQVFDSHGRRLYQFGGAGKEIGHFNGASGLWADSTHCLFVVDKNNKRVQVFHILGTSRRESAEANNCSSVSTDK